jgi:dissimilatory sulfite reductase (desulfoviridin) alpha/beta subunit
MKWTEEAEAAVKKVPFFVRKKVRLRVEKDAAERGKTTITLDDVNDTRQRFLSKMGSEIRGYQVDTCFGGGGCPNRCVSGDRLLERIEGFLKDEDLLGFLKKSVGGDLKFHHEFRVTIAECPNACSQPQIKDIGILGAVVPEVGAESCSLCGACVDVCKEGAVSLADGSDKPVIRMDACVFCGACVRVCPTGTLTAVKTGFRVMLGGRLGRHPRLAEEIGGVFSEDGVVDIVKRCVAFYKKHSRKGERFSVVLEREGRVPLAP